MRRKDKNSATYSLEQINPNELIDELDRVDSEESLRLFIERSWHILEPAREFVPGFHIDAICDHLEAVTRGDISRLLMNVPPGSMKSMTTDVFWPAWEWGPRNLPSTRYVSASYSEALTVRDNRRCRALITSPWYQRKWGEKFHLVSDQNAKIRYDNDKTGFKIATSVGGLGTGERGDRFMIDDPHNVKEGESDIKRNNVIMWFSEVVPTRVNDPETSAIVVIMQRVHESDVSGEILARELGYEHLMLPMEFEPERRCFSSVKPSYVEGARKLRVYYHPKDQVWRTEPPAPEDVAPEDVRSEKRYCVDPREEDNELLWADRIGRATLERDKKVLGEYACAGQLQQRPSPRGGGMFRREWFEVVDAAPNNATVVRGWDLAASTLSRSPYTAGCRMSRTPDGTIYIEDMRRKRGTPAEVESLIYNTATSDGHRVRISIPQDPGQAGKAQKRTYAVKLAGFNVHFSPETGSKEIRATGLAAQAEAGNVKVVRGPWNGAFFDEIEKFPTGKFKDQVDCAARAFNELIPKKSSQTIPTAPETIPLQEVA